MAELKERGVFWWLLLILIIATVLRVYQLDQTPPGLYPDEAMNGNNALEALRTGDYKIYYPENNGREGLLINIQALFLKFFGATEPWVLRFPSAIAGILTVWGLYLLGKELFSKRMGLVAAFFLATSFWHINFSRIGFRAILAPMFLVWALYLLHLSLRQGRESRRVYLASAVVGGAIFGLGFYTYIAYRVSPLLLALFIVFFRKDPNFWKVMLLFLGAAFIVALPIGIYYLQSPADFFGRTSQISVFSSAAPLKDLALNTLKTLAMFNFAGDANSRHNLPGRPELFWPVGLFFLLGIAVAVRAMLRHPHSHIVALDRKGQSFESWEAERNLRFGFGTIFLWLILAFLPVVISNEGLPHALRSILMLPPVVLLAAAGGIWTYSYFRKQIPRSGVLPSAAVFLGMLLVYEAAQTYFILWGRSPSVAAAFNAEYVGVGRTINRLSRQAIKYVVVEAPGVEVPTLDALAPELKIKPVPMPAQTVMFITSSWDAEGQKARNIRYLLPEEEKSLPPGGLKFYLK